MLLMFERGIRGGITQSVHKWAKTNNPYMGSEYKPGEPTRYLQYLDANNLYGWAMSQPLPTGGFCWIDVKPDEIGELANNKEVLENYTIVTMTFPLCAREWLSMEWRN